MDDQRRQKIIEAAFETFLRYGFRRTTMDDIAQQVGLSRPTLYLTFPNKEAIFRAVVETGQDRMLTEISAGLPGQGSLASGLRYAFEIWVVQPEAMTARSPAAEELLNTPFDFAKDVFDDGARRLGDLLAELITAAVIDPAALQPPAQARARVLVAATRGCKTAARDADDLRQLVEDLVDMTVAGLPLRAEETVPARGRDTDGTVRTQARGTGTDQ